jgi:hypothetical protein
MFTISVFFLHYVNKIFHLITWRDLSSHPITQQAEMIPKDHAAKAYYFTYSQEAIMQFSLLQSFIQ